MSNSYAANGDDIDLHQLVLCHPDNAMTNMQRHLYRPLSKQGAHTMRDHIGIAYQALKAGNATHEQARWLVAQALRNLRAAGIRSASRVPTLVTPPSGRPPAADSHRIRSEFMVVVARILMPPTCLGTIGGALQHDEHGHRSTGDVCP